MDLLNVLETADFDWVKRIDKVWSDDATDVAGIHGDVRKNFAKALTKLAGRNDSASPLGWVVTGPGGSGKTHLLSAFRRETWEKDGFFILADMSGVKDFWETLLLHVVHSLRVPEPNGRPQCLRLLDKITKVSRCGVDSDAIPGMFRDDLAATIKKAINGLYRTFPDQTQRFQDVLRAAVLLASEDIDISDCGRRWLLGLEPDAEAIRPFGFKLPVCDAKSAVEGLSWLMSLDGGFSVLALDQLDAIIKQHFNPDADSAGKEAATARSIIVGICDGLMTLCDITRRTLVVASCLNDSWSSLRESGLRTAVDRYESPIRLSNLGAKAQIEALVAGRMARALAKAKAKAPYPTWPFPPAVLEKLIDLPPRTVLQRCDQHIKNCLKEGSVHEAPEDLGEEPESVDAFPVDVFQQRLAAIDKRYTEARKATTPAALLEKEQEDAFWRQALACFARAFCHELPPMLNADILLDDDCGGDRKFPLLHAKLRFEGTTNHVQDRHLSLRALLQPHHLAFQNRLKTAMTQAGIDRNLSFRKLMLIHFGAYPGGKLTAALMEQFKSFGGVWVRPDEEAIRSLAGLVAVEKEYPDEWRDWVIRRKPVQAIPFLRDELQWLVGDNAQQIVTVPQEEITPVVVENVPAQPVEVPVPAPKKKRTRSTANTPSHIPVGKQTANASREVDGKEITLPLETLKQHIAILAGSGSGKTVLTRRIVEEAALCGTPSIVIDIANDLARLGQPWPKAETPASWNDEDKAKAKRYFEQVEVKIWTPGRSAANPLRLRQIPDLAAVADDEDELMNAVGMTLSALRDTLKTRSDNTKEGIVGAALKWMARNGGGDLEQLADVLADLPEDSDARIHPKAEKMAADMSAHLRGALITNPLFGGKGEPTDIDQLLAGANGRTRISVINLSGLGGSTESQQMFVNQLAMTLFGWIKKHPTNNLGGLLVIDEAKDFIPSVKSTPCKDSVTRFAAQARKYGMGLLLATQEPKSVDTKIISNCNTQFFGRQNSPATIEAAEALLERKGVAKLERGHFFLKSIAPLGAAPIRITTPLCLSYHPSAPLSADEVLELTRR